MRILVDNFFCCQHCTNFCQLRSDCTVCLIGVHAFKLAGFLGLSDVAEFCYKCTDVYDPTSEGGIPYDDPTVNVQWPDCGCEHKTSAKDKLHEPFAAQKFEYFEKW